VAVKTKFFLLSLTVGLGTLSCAPDRKPTRATAPAAVTAAATAAATATATAKTEPFNLVGTEWQLQDLAGNGIAANVHPTLAFPEAGKVAGNGSCNRFSGPSQIAGNELKLGPLASTRMACPEPAMSQETKYLDALQAAERYEWKDPYLLIYCKDIDKPLRFSRGSGSTPAQ
jgi:heat shock protein HslJ